MAPGLAVQAAGTRLKMARPALRLQEGCRPLPRAGRSALRVSAVAEMPRPAQLFKEAILLRKYQAHSSSLAAALVLVDGGARCSF